MANAVSSGSPSRRTWPQRMGMSPPVDFCRFCKHSWLPSALFPFFLLVVTRATTAATVGSSLVFSWSSEVFLVVSTHNPTSPGRRPGSPRQCSSPPFHDPPAGFCHDDHQLLPTRFSDPPDIAPPPAAKVIAWYCSIFVSGAHGGRFERFFFLFL